MAEWLESLVPWGTEFLVRVQSGSPDWILYLFFLITLLSEEEFYVLALPFVYWCLDRRIGAGLGYLVMISAWINNAFKYLFAIPRPADARLRLLVEKATPSFPSGHAQNAVTNWGYMALRFRNRPFWVVALLLMLLIGVSRVVLAVHFPQDVLGGWLIGAIVLLLYAWAEGPVSRWVARQARPVQYLVAMLLPLALIFLHPADTEGLYPAATAVTSGAALVGLGAGILMERDLIRFDAGGPWRDRLLRFLLGIAIVGVLYAGPSFLLPDDLPSMLEALIRFVRCVLLGWAVAFFCPWLFVRLGLAAQEDERAEAIEA
ncbi:MAG: phosphatase PAP2 family protein [Anaerolineae bacterium]